MFSIELFLFLKAALVGLSIAAPVGPISLLCIQRTLISGPRLGFISGLGAASADAVYGAIGAFGLTAVTQLFIEATTPLTLFGASFLAWLGFKMILSQPAGDELGSIIASDGADSIKGGDGIKAFASMFALTLSSPVTILSFVAVFSAINGSAELTEQDHSSAFVMVLGVFIGSACWWLMLAAGVSCIRHKLGPQTLLWVSRIAGGVLLSVALYQLASLIAEFLS